MMNPIEIIDQITALLEQLTAAVGGAAPAAPAAPEGPMPEQLPPASDEEVLAGLR